MLGFYMFNLFATSRTCASSQALRISKEHCKTYQHVSIERLSLNSVLLRSRILRNHLETQVGGAMKELGMQNDPRLFTAGAWPL